MLKKKIRKVFLLGRAIDVVLSFGGLMVLFHVYAEIVIAIKIAVFGFVFFIQKK